MITYALITLAVLIVLELAYFAVAKHFNIVDRPNERSSHHKEVLLGGGVIFFLSVAYYFFTHQFAFPLFFTGLALLTVISFVDDLRGLSSWLRLLAQLGAISVAFYLQLNGIDLWKIILIVIVFTGILNVYNFMDGINGMLAAYSLVVMGTFGYIELFELHFVDPAFLLTLMLAVLVFGFFNFRRQARCFSGDVGSIAMGFITLFLLVSFVKASPSASPSVSYLTLIIVFLADGVLTITKRFLTGKNIFEPHREHLYETLVNELKVPHIAVSSGYAVLQFVINVGYFIVADKNLYCFVCTVLLVLAYGLYFFFFNRKMAAEK